MSKINAIRLINLNYNNNAIRVSDETFHMNGESTFLSLRNGGGKSVLVQMIMALFVHKRYRDAKERPFESYFTTGKPTFILVEWALDHGAGFVMVGMMVRRRQEIDTEANEDLEIIQFISEYRHACPYDIHHLPVVEKRKKEIVLKNFSACRQLFDSYKKDSAATFFCYDANNSAQARQYFDKLMEYRINYKEWETILKKVNLDESGLSGLFADCRDEKGLVEKWLLDAVASKLNKEKDRMKEFQTILEKYVIQYKDNQSKIRRRDTIRAFGREAKDVMETAAGCQAVEEELRADKQRIGVFLWQLETAKNEAEETCAALEKEKECISADIAHLRYQQISKAVYEAMENERYHMANREMIGLEREAKEQEYIQAKHQLNLLDCARQQQELDSQNAECAQFVQQLEALNQKEQDFGRERHALGYTLRQYYEREHLENEQQALQQEAELEKLREQYAAEDEKAGKLRALILEHSASLGGMQANIQAYDAKEAAYNKRYAPGFVRNILGEYEPAALEICRQEYEKELDGLKKAYTGLLKAAEEGRWKQKELERGLEDAGKDRLHKEAQLGHAEEICRQYEKELKERRTILRYFGLDEQALYERDKILSAAQHMLSEIEWAKRGLEKEEDALRKEHQRLTQGRVLELPEEFEKLLEENGITYVYGMEWLKKNRYSEAENKKLVHGYPFLPYALLLSGRDMEKLKRLAGLDAEKMPYTSLPIALMIREQLECGADAAQASVIDFSNVSFYMLFNEHLLNEENLKQMTAEKERQIAKKKEQIEQRREEYESFFEKKEQLRSQSVTKELEAQAKVAHAQAKEELEAAAQEIIKQKEALGQQAEQLRSLQQQIQDNAKQQDRKERRLEDLKELEQAYSAYTVCKKQFEELQKELALTKEKEQLAMETGAKLRERRKLREIEWERLKTAGRELAKKAAAYRQYEKPQQEAGYKMQAAGIEEMESRYQAITSRLSLRQQEMERLLQDAQEKLHRLERELLRRQKKYSLADGEWKTTVYDARAEEYQEKLLAQKEQQFELKKAQWNEADKNAALAAQRLEQQRKLLMEKCQKEEPLPRAEIQPVAFEAEMEKREYDYRELERAQQVQQKRTGWYDENLTALAEYMEFMPKDEQQMREFLGSDAKEARQSVTEQLSGEELRRKKGMFVRDYNSCMERRQKQKDRLTGLLNQMVRKELFAEDFYRKPIEAMLTLTDDAGQVIRQLQTTLQSYESLMEKIQVDISVVEEEKARITELLGEYVHEVHKNLGRIDQNSTIQIRGKSVKMLKITLPDWEENASLYQIRIRDFMEETTQKGIELLDCNENAQEYFGVRMTTKNLYDVVAGIENVRIRLYKIEEQREYPITWSQVARNSGGEGFLSAFIILCSLLYYMRHDDSDLFAQRGEGKVLLMDNPFAKANSAHLLKPLMDMAQKTNTQLICLSGLGGESIYNRFDNIYVLNLIAAGMQSGIQYLKGEHMRGNEAETMLVSQIEVLGQQKLIF